MPQYLEALQAYGLDITESPPPRVQKEGWRERNALEEAHRLTGVAYMGLVDMLGVDAEDVENQMRERNGHGNTVTRKRLEEVYLGGKIRAIESLVPEQLRPLRLIGCIGLGLLRLQCPDNNGTAQERLRFVQVLATRDHAALYLFTNHPKAFDGNAVLADELREQHMQQLDPKVLAKVVNGQNGSKQRRRKK